ncbi:MAG: hypothetical protein K8T25_18110 [Planctomycetia bacterium]|nr:hypothetical protein [Planctomycetia bacterium]
MDYIRSRRRERAVRAAAQSRGYHADVLAEVPRLGTLRQELEALDVLMDLPVEIRRLQETHDMVRAATIGAETPIYRPVTTHRPATSAAPPAAIIRARGNR